ncbi:FMN-binding protein [Haloplasma contractile]|uniref:Fumarate reductase flavoprotein subunit n=1 Tax=Haloplasma contractile SSD-17B TaxID=1033810 RepID=U2EDM3_9MOLU|nr:FMN-binding protein [Haloplasma contractile]ERJ13083.1 fumarate reductase flavoprotein subunit [Haloplasma contractile SSD-17B]
MKKLLMLFSMFIITLTLTACGDKEVAPKVYNNGTYTGRVANPNYGFEEAVVTISDDEIVSIVLHRLEADGSKAKYDYYTGEEVEAGVEIYGGKTLPDLKYYRFSFAEEMVDQQSSDVDIIAGATASSEGWMAAVEQALEKAKIEDDTDTDAA